MSWTQISQGTWERPLGADESFLKFVADKGIRREPWAIRAPFNFIAHGSLQNAPDKVEACLRSAWQQLRFSVPNMGAYAIEDKLRYEVPDAAALESWTKDTFIVEAAETTIADAIRTRGPTSLAKLHYFPHTSQLLFSTSHWRIDGTGVFIVFGRYFELVAQCAAHSVESPAWGSETSRLCTSLADLAKLPTEPSPEITPKAEAMLATLAHSAGSVGIKLTGDATIRPEATIFESILFNSSETSAIISASKKRGISVTSAIHASIAATNYAFADPSNKSKHYTSTIRFGVRASMPPPDPPYAHAAGVFTTGYLYKVPAENSWLENATAYNTEYRRGYSDLLPAHQLYYAMLVEKMRTTPAPDTPSTSLDISSMGVMDKYIKPSYKAGDAEIEITEMGVGLENLTTNMGSFVVTFRGQLRVLIAYNEAFYESALIFQMLEFIKETTLKELGITP